MRAHQSSHGFHPSPSPTGPASGDSFSHLCAHLQPARSSFELSDVSNVLGEITNFLMALTVGESIYFTQTSCRYIVEYVARNAGLRTKLRKMFRAEEVRRLILSANSSEAAEHVCVSECRS